MSELVVFLLACIAEDEADAETLDGDYYLSYCPDGFVDALNRQAGKLLAECAAKRAILEGHYPIDPCDAHDASCGTVPCDTVLAVAQPYASRPGFNPAWTV